MHLYPDQVFDQLRRLETPRLIIRRMRMDDAEDMFFYSQDSEVARYVLWEAHKTIGDTKAYIRATLRNYRMGRPASLVIQMRNTGRVVGTIGFMWYQQDNAAAEVGYSLARDMWNQGVMTEALTALLDYAFRYLRINRIEAQHEVDNPASGRVMEKAGMKPEGVLRQRLYNKGKFVDVRLYAALRREYLKERGT